MTRALNSTGRPIFFALCGWNKFYAPVGAKLANSWRIAGDVKGYASMYNAVQQNLDLRQYAGPTKGYNDMDMLLGSGGNTSFALSKAQSRTQFSVWAVLASPLILGANLLDLSAFDRVTYSNRLVIAVNQDALGVQGAAVLNTCGKFVAATIDGDVPNCVQILARPLLSSKKGNLRFAVVLVNYGVAAVTVTCDVACVNAIVALHSPHVDHHIGFKLVDLWDEQTESVIAAGTFSAYVAGGGASVLYEMLVTL
jgi:alpha-galactosidase